MVEKRKYEVEVISTAGGFVLVLYEKDKEAMFSHYNFRIYYSDETTEYGSTDEKGEYKIKKDLTSGKDEIEDIELLSPTEDNPFLSKASGETPPLEDVEGDTKESYDSDYEVVDEEAFVVESITPGKAPLEGGNRVRITGQGFVDGTTVEVGGKEVSNLRVTTDGMGVYFDTPSSAAGPGDAIISAPGRHSETLSRGITYVSDIVETARTVTESYVVHLSEIRDRAKALKDAGELNESVAGELRTEAELAGGTAYDLIEIRARKGGGSLDERGVLAAWNEAYPKIKALSKEIYDITGPAKILV